MLTFLAMIVLMGIIHKPRISMYWTKDGMVSTPVFSQLMRRDRFLFILRFLHFVDNKIYNPVDPDKNELYKIREVSDMIRRRCSEAFYPGKKRSVDVSLVLFKQYIKSKRARFGIKLYQLCTTDGILLDYVIYHGGMAQELTEVQDALITENIPVTLMLKYLGKGNHLHVDNYYTSIALAKHLLQNDTHVTGTKRENRKQFPGELKRIALNKGESAFIQHDDIVIMKYRSLKNSSSRKPKVIHLLSTAHRPAQGNTNKRDRDGNIIRKCTCIIDYNYNMGGVCWISNLMP